MPHRYLLWCTAVALVTVVLAGCTIPETAARPVPTTPSATGTPAAPSASATAVPPSTTVPPTVATTPGWQLGARPLPLRPDGYGQIRPTPPALTDRRLPTVDLLPPPADGRYAATVAEVPDQVLARSTWQRGCPVARTDLRYLTMSFIGFDGHAHTGEMIVHRKVAEQVTGVFGRLFQARFPIEEMRVTTAAELTAAPTGDGNNTTAFVCRPITAGTGWSAHAYGLALDLNPFINPYTKRDLVLPELATSYVDRGWVRPGMVFAGDLPVRAFAAIGWSWGGNWTSPKDIQHFTQTGH